MSGAGPKPAGAGLVAGARMPEGASVLPPPPPLAPVNDHPQLHEPGAMDATRVALSRLHGELSTAQNHELEQAVIVQCMLQVLMQKGFIRAAELDQVYGTIRQQLVEMRQRQIAGPIVIPEDIAVDPALDLDCKAHHPACEASCCSTFHIFLTPSEAASGRYLWDVRVPYKLLAAEDGTCVYFDRSTLACGIWAERPKACRSFDCRKDGRVWDDYPKRVIKAELLERRAQAAAARAREARGEAGAGR